MVPPYSKNTCSNSSLLQRNASRSLVHIGQPRMSDELQQFSPVLSLPPFDGTSFPGGVTAWIRAVEHVASTEGMDLDILHKVLFQKLSGQAADWYIIQRRLWVDQWPEFKIQVVEWFTAPTRPLDIRDELDNLCLEHDLTRFLSQFLLLCMEAEDCSEEDRLAYFRRALPPGLRRAFNRNLPGTIAEATSWLSLHCVPEANVQKLFARKTLGTKEYNQWRSL